MLLETMWQVDVGLPSGSDSILHLAGNFPESTVVGIRVGSLSKE